MGLILSTTSLGIVVPVLKERGLTVTRYGQTLLASAIDDLSHSTAHIRVRATFALMIGFIVLSKWLGSEIILGAFLGGTVIALLPSHEGSLLRVKMDAIGYGFFIPVFFIMVGVRFDLPALLSSSEALVLAPLLLGIACLVQALPALLYRWHFSWRETFGAGMLLLARLSLIIAASSIALALGVIDHATNAAVVLLALVTCTLAPMLFNDVFPPRVTPARQGLILIGLGQLSILLAERLRRAGEKVILVGPDPERARAIEKRGFRVIIGDPIMPEVLRAAGVPTAATLP